jgi:hypothetical protein
MPRIFVDVHTPGNGKTYEFQLDSGMTVYEAKKGMIEEILSIENGGISLPFETVLLCDIDMKQKLPEHLSLYEANVKSGHRLLLV